MLKGDVFEKLTDVNFVYFIYPIIILQCLKNIIKVDQKIQGWIIFGQIGLGQIDKLPHHNKVFKLKSLVHH